MTLQPFPPRPEEEYFPWGPSKGMLVKEWLMLKLQGCNLPKPNDGEWC